MKQEQVQDFTRRISQSNRGALVVIIYEIIFAYIKDAEDALAEGNYEGFKEALAKAARGVDELMHSLNFQYEISGDLYSLYVFVKETIAKAVIKKQTDGLADAKEVLMNLYTGFKEAAKQDYSKPLMQNTQQVYAGMTYGRNHLTETFQEPESSRGFFA